MPPILRIDGRRWAVRLSGEMIDLSGAAELFGGGRQIVRDHVLPKGEEIVLQADEFELLQDATEVYDAAERILVALNAVLYLEDPARKPLAISSVHQHSDNGNWNITMFAESASFRLRGARVRGHAGNLGAPPPPTPQSIWVQVGLSEEVVADALSYLRGTPDWIALYKTYEAMNKDVIALRPRKGPISGWPSQPQISAFTRDAQLHRHSKSWCDKKGITSRGAMTFNEASALVRSMIKTWIEWRA
jgi:hypothetical protein